jgi:competence protein ComEC
VAQITRGCAPAFFLILIVVLAAAGYFGWRWYKQYQPPPASGSELAVHVLDVDQGDAILIVGPEDAQTKKRKAALVDAGDTGKGKVVLDALKRYGVEKIDLFIATHAHADHIGGADEVIKVTSVSTVVDAAIPPPGRESETPAASNKKGATPSKGRASGGGELPTTKAYRDFLESVEQSGATYEKAEPGKVYDLGGGAVITILAPIEPHFTKDQLRSGGNEPNANSVVARLDYGSFSMLLTGDAEAQTEDRMINKDVNLAATVLKVGHHGSKYATSDNFIKRVKPQVAVISDGEWNRYGHPSPAALDRLKAAGVKLYRTDLQGEITITTKGKGYEIKTAQEATSDLWAGREAQKDDSAGRGFIAYGDFGPPPKPPKEKKEKTAKGK